MKEEEIVKSNLLIAEFMDFNLGGNSHYHCYPDIRELNTLLPPQHMKFQEDWNWLMPAALKCYLVAQDEMEAEDWCVGLQDAAGTFNITSLFNEVTQFIEYYNQNKI